MNAVPEPQPSPSSATTEARGPAWRWAICALLFGATVICYIDRGTVGQLKGTLRETFHWDDTDIGHLGAAFTAGYAIGYSLWGWALERLGTRLGFALAVLAWSAAAAAHGLVGGLAGFVAARVLLGIGEGGNFPASLRAIAEWFPTRERALAIGIFNAGANVGGMVVPLLVPAIAVAWGWRAAFVVTGAVGAVWVGWWWAGYRRPEEHPLVSPEQLAWLRGDAAEPPGRASWAGLLADRRTWAVIVAKLLTDPIWWFWFFWLPGFLKERFQLNWAAAILPQVLVYGLADAGSVGGGWLSSWLIARGMAPRRARALTMLACALAVLPVIAAPHVHGLWLAVTLVAVAAAAHQGWSANLFASTADMYPRRSVAAVVGIGGSAGAIGGIFNQELAGHVLTWTHGDYTVPFIVAGSSYVIALIAFSALRPRDT